MPLPAGGHGFSIRVAFNFSHYVLSCLFEVSCQCVSLYTGSSSNTMSTARYCDMISFVFAIHNNRCHS